MRPCEVSWFAALCDDDYEQLGVVNPSLESSWSHCRDIALTAQAGGFDNVLLPSGYSLGIDSVAFAGGIAPQLTSMRALLAVRCGEMWVPQLARQIATLQHMFGGRLTVNIISSDLPGESLESKQRYQRTRETMIVLRQLLSGEPVSFRGEFVTLELDAPRIARDTPHYTPFYFGGLSDDARNVAAECADVYLMWPDTLTEISSLIDDMRSRAETRGRRLSFGYRVHVIVRDSETEAREAAALLIEKVDDATGDAIRAKSLDSNSVGVRRQAELRRDASNDGFAEGILWTGIGKARSGCGAALVGTPAQVIDAINEYRRLGIDAFILSGYPHRDECERFARDVLPLIEHGPLSFGQPR